MPIKPENRWRYPKDWKAISLEVRERAEGRCECVDECGLHPWGRCVEKQGRKAFFANGKIILTVAHLDHIPENCGTHGNRKNLKAMCQRCHLRYDREHHAETARATREAKSAQGRLL